MKNIKIMRCWEFFKCPLEKQKGCLLSEMEEHRCWLVNVACCQMESDVPRPLSIKHVICKSCGFYKEFSKI